MLTILSLFPGLDLWGRAFEEVFGDQVCVVRGPDVVWGGDIREFHPTHGIFDGVIGGPPCQMYSPFGALNRHRGYAPTFGNLIPEYERCVAEARPDWFLMENVSRAPTPVVTGYQVTEQVLSNRELGEVQNRIRRISFGTKDGARLHIQHRPEPEAFARTVTAGSGGGNIIRSKYPLAQALKLQGLPADMLDQAPFTSHGKLKAVANGVPLPMGRSIARAVQLYLELREINKALGRGAQRASGILVDAA